jgi:hypothetical protein
MEEKLIPEVEGMKNEALVPETIETETTETVVADVQNNEEEPAEVAPEVDEPEAAEKTAPQSKEEVVARLKELVQNGGDVERAELESLKQVYYRLHNAQAAAAREEYIAAGGDPEAFMPAPDPLEADFKAQMSLLREIRAKAFEAAEKEKQDSEIANARKSQVGSGDRSEKIRTYNYPQGRITDHRIGMSIFQMENFLNGDIDAMVDNLIAADRAERLKGEEE